MMGKENHPQHDLVRKNHKKKHLSKQAAEAGGPWNRQWGQEQTWFNSSDAAEADDDVL